MKTLRHVGSLAFVLGLFTVVFAGIPWYVIVPDPNVPIIPLWLQIAVFCLLGGILVVLATVALEQKKNLNVESPQRKLRVEGPRFVKIPRMEEKKGGGVTGHCRNRVARRTIHYDKAGDEQYVKQPLVGARQWPAKPQEHGRDKWGYE